MNNTSVIILFEVNKKTLLLPGDTQLENWQYALQDPKIKKHLKKTTVYKVAHHCSTNATPKSLWNLFDNRSKQPRPNRIATLLSTKRGKHENVPIKSLVDALTDETNFSSTEDWGKSKKMARSIRPSVKSRCVLEAQEMRAILKVVRTFLVLFSAFFFLSCTDVRKIQYNSNADRDKLLELKGKNVIVISFRYNPRAFAQKALDSSLVEVMLSKHQLIFEKEFADIFNLKDLPKSSPLNTNLNPHDSASVRNIIETAGMDGALIVDCTYGYLEQALLTEYYLASDTYLFNSEGEIVWNFLSAGVQ